MLERGTNVGQGFRGRPHPEQHHTGDKRLFSRLSTLSEYFVLLQGMILS